MVFNSSVFLLFFLAFFLIYWFVINRNLKLQNAFLLIYSYFFYAYTDWRLLSYLIGVTLLNYILGIYVYNTTNNKNRRILVYIGVLQGIGGLIFFKYFNFFIDSFNSVFQLLNISINIKTLNIIIPLGISFFTFRTISYILDIDRNKIKPTKDWLVFFNYVSFFPSLLSGPIDRAKLLVPQLEKPRIFKYEQATNGLRQILWGLFKKLVIADNIAEITNQFFSNPNDISGILLIIGAFLYSIQIYTDFSGYTDMALGIARLLGFEITKNFDFPFFAQNIADYWRRWHISLTSWLTEYIFTPLSIKFRYYGKTGLILAIIINFIVIGAWHGANWTFIIFGLINGLYFIPLIIKGNMNKKKTFSKDKILPSFSQLINILKTFTLVTISLIVFRAGTITQSYIYIKNIITNILLPSKTDIPYSLLLITIVFSILMFIIEWLGKNDNYAIENIIKDKPQIFRWTFYSIIIFIIAMYAQTTQTAFIYFQF